MPEVHRTTEVFGVTRDPVLSYVERDQVDERFREAVSSDRHIVVYGASKQGETALVHHHLTPDEREVTVYCSPTSTAPDVYRSLL